MTIVSLHLEDDLKRELDGLCAEMGISLSTFFTVYIKKALRDRRIPFEITGRESAAEPERLDWGALRRELRIPEARSEGADGMCWGDVKYKLKTYLRENR